MELITLSSLFAIGLGHLKLFSFKKIFKLMKNGKSSSLTLFSKIVRIYGIPLHIIL